MKLLLVAATEAEISPLLRHLEYTWKQPFPGHYTHGSHALDLCISGVGLMAATYHITRSLSASAYDLALQAGIGGAFNRSLPLGSLVVVSEETLGDLGAEDHDHFLDIFELGLQQDNVFPFRSGTLPNTSAGHTLFPHIRRASSLTIHTVSGRESTVQYRSNRWNCDVESMEGAAFHYVALQTGTSFVQLRAISNYVEPRNRAAWQIGPAVQALNAQLIRFTEALAAGEIYPS